MKNIFASKTFWFNAFSIAAGFAVNLPPKFAVPVMGVANIGLRILTTGPVTFGNALKALGGGSPPDPQA